MGAGIVLFAWLFVAMIGLALWLGALAMFVIGRRRRSRALIWAGGVPLALSSLVGIGLVGMATYGFIWNSRPENVYQLTFGAAPAPSVIELQSKNFAFADSGTTFLKFKATPAMIRKLTAKSWRLVKSANWQAWNLDEFLDKGAPEWWTPAKTGATQMYVANERFGNFGLENEVLLYEPATRQAHYGFVGVD